MSRIEEGFKGWLDQCDRTAQETLQFALRAWQSSDLLLNSKYELVLRWLSKQQPCQIFHESLTEEEFETIRKILEQLLSLRAQPGLIGQEVKRAFIEWFLQVPFKAICSRSSPSSRTKGWLGILYGLLKFEPIQDYFRLDYDLYTKVFGHTFNFCVLYLTLQEEQQKTLEEVNALQHLIEFIATVLKTLKEIIPRIGYVDKFSEFYTKNILVNLVNLMLQLRNSGSDFWNELRELEHLLTFEFKDIKLRKRLMNGIHLEYVRLCCIECAVVNRKGLDPFLEELLTNIVDRCTNHLNGSAGSVESNRLQLQCLASFFEILKRRDINLNITIGEQKAVNYLGERIYAILKQYREDYLPEILRLLCSILRLNPLILEEYFYEMTVWMILIPKNSGDAATDPGHQQQQLNTLFAEYLMLLIGTFRRLSRVEKFVVNLLRELNKQLNNEEGDDGDCPRKKRKLHKAEVMKDESNEFYNPNFQLFLKDLFEKDLEEKEKQMKENRNLTSISSAFSKLKNYWPSDSVGLAFSQMVTGLMFKPSLVIGKSLSFALNDLLKHFEEKSTPFSDNEMLLLDFHVALLCQYFTGFKLTEQCTNDERNLSDILTQRSFILEILRKFGLLLLEREHEPRLMCAFLQLTYFASCFQLMLVYYRADGCKGEHQLRELLLPMREGNSRESNGSKIHDFLTTEEWHLIKQRVLNFGRTNCKYLLQRLYLQRAQAALLLSDEENSKDMERAVAEADNNRFEYDLELIEISLSRETHLNSLLTHLQRNEKLIMATHLIESDRETLINLHKTDFELIEFVAYNILERVSSILRKLSMKGSWLNALECDFRRIMEDGSDSVSKMLGSELMRKLIEFIDKDYEQQQDQDTMNLSKESNKVLSANSCGKLKRYFEILMDLPLGLLRCSTKTLILCLHLALYHDLGLMKSSGSLKETLLEIIKDMFHFGPTIPLLKYFSLKHLLWILPPKKRTWELYEYFIGLLSSDQKGHEKFAMDFVEYFQPGAENIQKMSEQSPNILTEKQRELLLLILKTLSSPSLGKHYQKQYKRFLRIFSEDIHHYFHDFLNDSDGMNLPSGHQAFVEATLPGFLFYAQNIIRKIPVETNKEDEEQEESMKDNATDSKPRKSLDEDFKRLFKLYIGNSMDYRNENATKLMEIALKYHLELEFNQMEIELILSTYWQQINADLNSGKLTIVNEQATSTDCSTQLAIKLILEHKSNEDFLILLKTITLETDLTKDSDTERTLGNLYNLLELIAKCPLSQIKGAIFNEEYKRFALSSSMVSLREALRRQDHELPHKILQCQLNLIENRSIPLSLDTVDTILGFLADIRIEEFSANLETPENYQRTCRQMIDICNALIKHRSIYLLNRMPQYTHVVRGLVRSIVWYKCGRQKDVIPADELNHLSEFAVRLETIWKTLTEQELGKNVKRMAPFLLTSIIELIVSKKRSLTLYNKIRLHVEGMCHSLIGICDHRAGNFILRVSSEAGRELYKTLLKDYDKYHKFKGKM